ncbi:type III secretion system chaperone family protein [Flavobacterium selenitireducens]|uniref:YbjN domain-containing protein n=1 Tax=Flavobacterium selenitireducens TaxID=2722704 RepID=UPI00168C08BD|nr:YbjN domain-containing protein [Flavobacterium selenitireducens]MBD3581749.1 YbjN domain-containing protein [Flavobacterium selenitireducens]
MKDYFDVVKGYLTHLELEIKYENRNECVLIASSEQEGIFNLIICVAYPIVIFEQFLFEIKSDSPLIYKELLKKNRDIIHGAFVLDETGRKVIFRDSLQLENLDLNEFNATLNSLSLLLSEYSEQIINFSKN